MQQKNFIYLFAICVSLFKAMPIQALAGELSAGLQTKGSLVSFPVRPHAGVVGQVPSWWHVRDNQLMYLSHFDVSLPLFLPPFPFL